MVFLLAMTILAVFLIFDKAIVKIFAFGFESEAFEMTVELSRIMMVAILFIAVYFLLQGYLQIKGSFFAIGITSVPLNIAVIASVVISVSYGYQWLAYGTIIGYIATFIMFYLVAKKHKYKFSPSFAFRDKNIRKLLMLVFPVFLGKSITQINIMLDRTIASMLPAGNIASLNYANRIVGFITAVFVVSVATAIFPKLSRLSANKNTKKIKSTFITSASSMSLLVMPITAGTLIFSEEIVTILFMRGAFTQESVEMTASVLSCYTIGLLAFSIKDVILNVFYAIGDTKTPTINSVIALFINIVLNLILIKPMGAAGLALATSISGLITLVILVICLRKKIGQLGLKKLFVALGKMLVATVGMGLIVIPTYAFLLDMMGNMFVSLTISVLVGVVVYFIINMLLQTRELAMLVVGVCEKLKIR